VASRRGRTAVISSPRFCAHPARPGTRRRGPGRRRRQRRSSGEPMCHSVGRGSVAGVPISPSQPGALPLVASSPAGPAAQRGGHPCWQYWRAAHRLPPCSADDTRPAWSSPCRAVARPQTQPGLSRRAGRGAPTMRTRRTPREKEWGDGGGEARRARTARPPVAAAVARPARADASGGGRNSNRRDASPSVHWSLGGRTAPSVRAVTGRAPASSTAPLSHAAPDLTASRLADVRTPKTCPPCAREPP
jgi:hypothetical protein